MCGLNPHRGFESLPLRHSSILLSARWPCSHREQKNHLILFCLVYYPWGMARIPRQQCLQAAAWLRELRAHTQSVADHAKDLIPEASIGEIRRCDFDRVVMEARAVAQSILKATEQYKCSPNTVPLGSAKRKAAIASTPSSNSVPASSATDPHPASAVAFLLAQRDLRPPKPS